MKQVVISKLAKLDLLSIWNYIAEDSSEKLADNFIDRIEEKFRLLLTQPEMGRLRLELRAGLRSHPVISYVVFLSFIRGRIGNRQGVTWVERYRKHSVKQSASLCDFFMFPVSIKPVYGSN